MEDPKADIPHIIHLLTQSPPTTQRATIEKYFSPTASFTHPFCRTGSFDGSRWLIWCIYRWYKVLSPRIEISVRAVAYDEVARVLYVSLRQVFRIWVLPFRLGRAEVDLVTVLGLVPVIVEKEVEGKGGKTTCYVIQSQNDLYQVNEFVKFFSLFGVVSVGVYVWQILATAACVLGAVVCWPVSWVEQRVVGGNRERGFLEAIKS